MIVSKTYYRVLHDHPTHRHPLPLPFVDRSFSFSTRIGHNQASQAKGPSKGGSPSPQVATTSVGGLPSIQKQPLATRGGRRWVEWEVKHSPTSHLLNDAARLRVVEAGAGRSAPLGDGQWRIWVL